MPQLTKEEIFKLFEFDFLNVTEHPDCFQLFLAHAKTELNSEALYLYIHLELLLTRTGKHENIYRKLVSLTESHNVTRALKSEQTRTLNFQLKKWNDYNLDTEHNNSYVSNMATNGDLLSDAPSMQTMTTATTTNTAATTIASNVFSHLFFRRRSSLSGKALGSDATYEDLNQTVFVRLVDLYAKCKALRKLFYGTNSKYQVNVSNAVLNNVEDSWREFKEMYMTVIPQLFTNRQQQVEMTKRDEERSEKHNNHDADDDESLASELDRSECETEDELYNDEEMDTLEGEERQAARSNLESIMNNAEKLVESMFGSSRLVLMLTLSSDIFPRFKRSKNWIRFISTRSLDELKKFGTSKSSLQIEPLLLTPHDLTRATINAKDVELAKVLLRDYYHWKPITQKKLSVYYSNFKVMTDEAIEQCGFLHAFRLTYEFDKSALDMARMFISKKYYTALSHWKDMQSISYVPLQYKVDEATGKRTIENYGTSILYYRKRMIVFKREFIQAHTLIHDEETGTYLDVFKVCDHINAPESKKGYKRALSYGVAAFTEMGDKCRYTSVFMVNLRGHLETKSESPTLVERQSIKAHTRQAVKNMQSFADEASLSNFELDDDLKILRTLREHQEYNKMERTSRNISQTPS